MSSPPGLDPRTVQPVASRYTDYAIPAAVVLVSSMKCSGAILSSVACPALLIFFNIIS